MSRRTGESASSKEAEFTMLRSRLRSFPPMTSTIILKRKGGGYSNGLHTDAMTRFRTPIAALRAALASSLLTSEATEEAPMGVTAVQTCRPSSLTIPHYRCCQRCPPPTRDDDGNVGGSRGRGWAEVTPSFRDDAGIEVVVAAAPPPLPPPGIVKW